MNEQTSTIKAYLVGGAVRDLLLGLPQKDRDWVVVGAEPAQMEALGYQQVGKDFPVFLHPDTKEEYALARIERKVGLGYTGFSVDASKHVTLEEDLARRDLTINAIAQDANGNLVDPYGGQADLQNRILRHVSPAFVEDPVRVLRVARFMARYANQGFEVAPETMALMRTMVDQGEVDHLVPERIWAELAKALVEPRPAAFLATLRACGALERILPEVDALYGVEQAAQWHPEIDTGIHTEMVLEQAAQRWPGDLGTAFACLVHDLGKALTPKDQLPKHHGHELGGLPPVKALCERLRVPAQLQRDAAMVCEHHLGAHRLFEMRTGSVLSLLEKVSNGLRSAQSVEVFARSCEADKRGRAGLEENPYPQADHLRALYKAIRGISSRPFVDQGLTGPDMGQAMRVARLEAISAIHGKLRETAPNNPPAQRPRP